MNPETLNQYLAGRVAEIEQWRDAGGFDDATTSARLDELASVQLWLIEQLRDEVADLGRRV